MFTSMNSQDAIRAEAQYRREHLRAIAERRDSHTWVYNLVHRSSRDRQG